jgi:hypothetical protein
MTEIVPTPRVLNVDVTPAELAEIRRLDAECRCGPVFDDEAFIAGARRILGERVRGGAPGEKLCLYLDLVRA